MRHAILILLAAFAISAFAAIPPSRLPTRDAAIVIPLLQAFTSADTYQDVLRILGNPELDIGSASPNAIFTLTDGRRIKVRTRRMTEIKDITLHPAHRAVIEGEGQVLFDATLRPNQSGAAKSQNGVFFTYTGYMTTVLELKDGHFRYWFETDVKRPKEPDYPLTGEYSISSDTITLKHDLVSQREWTFRAVNGIVTLWRPEALDGSKTDKSLDLKRLKSYGLGSILVATDKPAEELWKHRGPPSP
jgi:hypothetical protein